MKETKFVFSFILIFFIFTFLFYKSYSSFFVRSILANQPEEEQLLDSNQILVSYLPLEQGESTLIQLANGGVYLVDTGNKKSIEQLIDLLHQHRIVQIDGLILTNAGDDHFDGFFDLVEEFHVKQVYIPELTASSFSIPDSYHNKITYLKKDDVLEWDPLKVTVLAPTMPLSLSPQENSLVFQLTHQKIHFLFTSEINEEVEKRIMKQYPLQSEILKVSDFGNNTASNPEFLEQVDPQVAIIFSSDPELFETSEDVIERLKETWADVYEVSKDGEIQITSNGTDYQIEKIKRQD